MIYAVVGKPGKGKSYFLARKSKEFLEQGIDVYSNIEIDETKLLLKHKRKLWTQKIIPFGKLYFWQSLEDFRFIIGPAIVLLDEAGAYFEPREWAKFSIEDRVKFQQHRKQKLDIYLTVQSFGRVDNVIRQLTATIFQVNKFGKLFIVNKFEPEEIELKKRTSKGTEFFFFNKNIASAYDTYATVNLREKPVKTFPLMIDRLYPKREGKVTL